MRPWFHLLAAVSVSAADFPTPYNTEQGEGAPMPAEQAAKEMKMPAGFRCQVFAAEPDVQNPIAMAWDHKGRMWVAENYTYAERSKRFDLALRDRVIILEDKDNDGKAESRKVFTDDVQMLTSVEVGHGGVWLFAPPQILFIADKNEDDVPDAAPEVVLDGFTVAEANYHNFANGLRWGPDGWLYGRCGHSCPAKIGVPGTPDEDRVPMKGGIFRFNPKTKVAEVLTHGTTNPWGHDWDENGEGFFINTVTGHLWHLIPGAHLKDSSPSLNPNVFDRLDMIADHYHFDTAGGWQKSKAQNADAFGGGHAHIGMMIYQGNQWPDYWRGKLLTLNMHGRRTNVERLEPHGSSYVGKHEPDVFNASAPFFRGIDIRQGPDGNVFIIDWSDTGECHESTGVHRTSGRIFKVSYGEAKKPDFSDLTTLSAEGMIRLLKNPNPWYWRQAQNRWVSIPSLDPDLRRKAVKEEPSREAIFEYAGGVMELLAKAESSVIRQRAYQAPLLDTFVDAKVLVGALSDEKDEHIRASIIRHLTDDWRLDDMSGRVRMTTWDEAHEQLLQRFIALAKSDSSGLVQLTLSSTLQRLPVNKRIALASALAPRATADVSHTLDYLIWFGIGPVIESKPMSALEVAKQTDSPQIYEWMARSFALKIEKQPELLDKLLEIGSGLGMKPALQRAIVLGMVKALNGWRKAPSPNMWDFFSLGLQDDKLIQPELNKLRIIFGDGIPVGEMRAVALDKSAELPARVAALKTLIEARPPELRAICEAALETRELDTTAVRGLALFDDPAIADKLVKRYRSLSNNARAAVIDAMVARPAFASVLLKDIADGKIARTDLTAFHARQIKSFNDEALTKQLTAAWGELRESAGDKQKLIADLKAKLTPAELAKANKSLGRVLFTGVCSSCHTMYGEGGKVGPDLTGSGRANLDYLLENIADPSGVVSADYRMSILTLKDGRVMSGVVKARTDRTLTLRTLTEEITAEKSEIVKEDVSPMSMMPEGLFLALGPDQVRDLIAYLMHPVQVPMPK
ncbi:MAG: c-type cytochrome [Verrucomicrobiaceae bacterium]|nr:c-type cytochrome [Verrucomicrobiaceae bacterium]